MSESDDQPQIQKPWLFKKGQSGNPNGRPKGKSLLSEIREKLDNVELLGKPNPDGRTNREVLAETIIHHARKGNAAFARLLMEYLYGKPKIRIEQKMTGNIEGGKDINPEIAAIGLRAMLEAVDQQDQQERLK